MKFTTVFVVAASALTTQAWYNNATASPTTTIISIPTVPVLPTGGFTTVSGLPTGGSNGTAPTGTSNPNGPAGTGSPTNTPVGPSGSTVPFTGSAASNSAFGGLAAVGLVIAYII